MFPSFRSNFVSSKPQFDQKLTQSTSSTVSDSMSTDPKPNVREDGRTMIIGSHQTKEVILRANALTLQDGDRSVRLTIEGLQSLFQDRPSTAKSSPQPTPDNRTLIKLEAERLQREALEAKKDVAKKAQDNQSTNTQSISSMLQRNDLLNQAAASLAQPLRPTPTVQPPLADASSQSDLTSAFGGLLRSRRFAMGGY
tara:strand:- start:173 stop:763 length:591 start_codon:yes stop_codon:yes gene_type:complete